MRTRAFPVVLLACAMAFTSCRKEDPAEEPQPGPDYSHGQPTPVGTPVGAATSLSIDGSGGSISSPDGRLTVTIPAGALAAATEITIQPITNTCIAGVGQAYQLGPDGQQFAQPVTLTLQHTPEDLEGTSPFALQMAVQGDDQIWYTSDEFVIDSIAGTTTVQTTHFSPWGPFATYRLAPPSASVEVNEVIGLEVLETRIADDELGTEGFHDALVGVFDLSSETLISWHVNNSAPFNTANGTLVNWLEGGTNIYTAPSSIDGMETNPAQVDATLFGINGTGGPQLMILLSWITVYQPGYSARVDYSEDGWSSMNCFSDGYTDHATFPIPTNLIVNPTTIQNTAGNFQPFYGTGPCTCEMTVPVDHFQVDSVTVYQELFPSVEIEVWYTTVPSPGFILTCDGIPPIDSPPSTSGAYYLYLSGGLELNGDTIYIPINEPSWQGLLTLIPHY